MNAPTLPTLLNVITQAAGGFDCGPDTRQAGRFYVRGYGEADIDGPLLELATPAEVLGFGLEQERCTECGSDDLAWVADVIACRDCESSEDAAPDVLELSEALGVLRKVAGGSYSYTDREESIRGLMQRVRWIRLDEMKLSTAGQAALAVAEATNV